MCLGRAHGCLCQARSRLGFFHEPYTSLQAFINVLSGSFAYFFPCSWPASFCQLSTVQGCVNCCLTWNWRVSARCQLWEQLFCPVLDIFYLAVSFNFCHILRFCFSFPITNDFIFKKLLPSSMHCWLDYEEGGAFTVLARVQWRVGAIGTRCGELWSTFMGKRRDLRWEGLPRSLLSQPFFSLTWGVSDPSWHNSRSQEASLGIVWCSSFADYGLEPFLPCTEHFFAR